MTVAGLTTFAVAYFVALAMPGPGVTALLARVLARGTRGAAAFIAGEVVGGFAWFAIAATGLAVLASTFEAVFTAIRWGSAAYLAWLAWKFWTAPAVAVEVAADATPDGSLRLFLAGLAINLGNPKNVVFFLALLPTVVELETLDWIGFAELGAIIVFIASSVLAVYAAVAGRARAMFTSARAVRWMNRGSAGVMAGTAMAVVAK